MSQRINLSKRLRQLREDYGYTAAQLAEWIDKPNSVYRSYESGRATPSISTLIDLAGIYRVSVEQFLEAPESEPAGKVWLPN